MSDENHSTWDVERRTVLQTGAILSGAVLTSTGSVAASGVRADVEASNVEQIECGETVAGELTPDDDSGFRGDGHAQDRYALTVPGDTYVTVRLVAAQPTPDEGQHDPYLYLLDPTGAIVAEDDDSAGDLNSQISQVRLDGGQTYTVVATSFGPEDYFAYDLSVECVDLTPDATIGCDESIEAFLGSDDGETDPTGFRGADFFHDVFAFSGSGGQFVTVSMETPEPGNPQVGDPYLYLLGPNGHVIAEDDDGGVEFSALVSATLPQDGEYSIVATSAAPGQRFGYTVSLDCPPAPEPERIECGQTVFGALTQTDPSGFRGTDHYQDLYRFQGTAGDLVTVSMGPPQYTYGDTYLYLLDPADNVIAEDDDSGVGTDSLIARRLPQSGEYTIVATSFGPDELFEYELSLGCQSDPLDCPPRCVERIDCGATVDGALEPGDDSGFRGPGYYQDVYCFDGSRGDTVTVSLSARQGVGDPYLYLVGPDGGIVAADDDGGGGLDSLIQNYPLAESGQYKIVATSFDSGAFFEYDLTFRCTTPEAQCIGFNRFQPDTQAPLPFTQGDLTIREVNPQGFPSRFRDWWPQNNPDGNVELQFPDDGLVADVPGISYAEVDVVGFASGPITLEAYDSGGTLVDAAATSGVPRTESTLSVSGSDISTLRLSGGRNEGLVLRMCFDR